MKKILLAIGFFFIAGVLDAYAGAYLDNQYKFRITLPENWTVSDENEFDEGSLLELHKENAAPNNKSLIAISAVFAKSSRKDFSFATMNEEEQSLVSGKLEKTKEKLPENSVIDSQIIVLRGDNSFLVVSMHCPNESGDYKAVIAITYAGGKQYGFYLFAAAADLEAAEDFNNMLGSLKIFD